MVDQNALDLARLSCQQSQTDKVHCQIDFLVDLKAEHLIAETTLANYRKSPADQRSAHAVYVDKIGLMEALEKANSGGGGKKSKSSSDE